MFWIWTLLTIPTKATASSPLGVTIVALLVSHIRPAGLPVCILAPSHPFASQETDLSLGECSQFLWLLLTLRMNSKSFLQKSALTPGSYLSLLSPPSPATPATLLWHEHTEFLPALTVPFASSSPNPRPPALCLADSFPSSDLNTTASNFPTTQLPAPHPLSAPSIPLADFLSFTVLITIWNGLIHSFAYLWSFAHTYPPRPSPLAWLGLVHFVHRQHLDKFPVHRGSRNWEISNLHLISISNTFQTIYLYAPVEKRRRKKLILFTFNWILMYSLDDGKGIVIFEHNFVRLIYS